MNNWSAYQDSSVQQNENKDCKFETTGAHYFIELEGFIAATSDFIAAFALDSASPTESAHIERELTCFEELLKSLFSFDNLLGTLLD